MIPILSSAFISMAAQGLCEDVIREPWAHPFASVHIVDVSRLDTMLVELLQLRHEAAWLWPGDFYRAYYYDEARQDTVMQWPDVIQRLSDAVPLDPRSDSGQRLLWAYAAIHPYGAEAEIANEIMRREGALSSVAADILGELSMPLHVRTQALDVLDTVPMDIHIARAYARTLCQLGMWRMALDPTGALAALDSHGQDLFEDVRSVMFRRREDFEEVLGCVLETCFAPMFDWRVTYLPILQIP